MQIERQRKAKEKACKEKAEKQKAEIVGRIRLRQGFRRDKGSRAERPERKNTNRKASIRVLRFLVVQNPRPCQSGIAAAPGHRRPRFRLGWLPPGRGQCTPKPTDAAARSGAWAARSVHSAAGMYLVAARPKHSAAGMYPVAAGSLYAEAGMEMTIPRQIHHEDGRGIVVTRRVHSVT